MNRLENLSSQLTPNPTKVVEGKNFIKVVDNRTGTLPLIQTKHTKLSSKNPEKISSSEPRISSK